VYTTDAERRSPANRRAQPRFDRLTPSTPLYAALPVLQGFNWSDCLVGVDDGQWFLVVFRSIRRADADERLLTEYDDLAYAEALTGQGLLHYFRGSLNERRECLSLCLWEHQQQARDASRLPLHLQAARIARDMYESYVVERYHLIKRSGMEVPEVQPI
jgi:hypothetical protein